MHSKLRRSGLRAVGAAALVFAVMLLAAPAASLAASYTLAFSGTVTGTAGINGGVFSAFGVAVGDTVSGTLTINSLVTDPDVPPSGGNAGFNQPLGSYTFHVSHPGEVDLTLGGSGGGEIVTAGDPLAASGLRFSFTGSKSKLELTYQTAPNGGPLTTLDNLPNTAAALIALFGGPSPRAYGNFSVNGFGQVAFDIAYAVTPIPAALPLFVSALGGLGFAAWRRRHALSTAGSDGGPGAASA